MFDSQKARGLSECGSAIGKPVQNKSTSTGGVLKRYAFFFSMGESTF